MFFQSSAAMLLNTNLSTAATTLTKWLVSIPSVSSTKGSSVITQSIYEGLGEFPYFKQHPEHLVLVPHQNDSRASIVALVKTIENIQDTLVLLCDVDTNSPAHYGILKNISTQSDELERQLLKLVEENQSLKQKLEQHDALFGLGVLESKCATGCMLAALKELSDNHVRLNLNILFVCTSGKGQQHQGIKHCIPVMQQLCSKENLTLRLTLNAQPQLNNPTFANSAALLNVATNTIAPRSGTSLDKDSSGNTSDNGVGSTLEHVIAHTSDNGISQSPNSADALTSNNDLDNKDAFNTDAAGDNVQSHNTANALASLSVNAALDNAAGNASSKLSVQNSSGESTPTTNQAHASDALDTDLGKSQLNSGLNSHNAIQQALTIGIPELCLYTGNYGKIEPSFYILGQSSSVNQPFAGFSASLIAAELIHEFELNPKILQKLHQKPLLPTFDSLKVKDFGKEFSPDGVQLSFNLPMLPAIDLSDVLELMKEVAAKAIENAAEVVDEREALLAKLNNQPFVPQIQDAEVISFSDLLERACSNYAGDMRQAVSTLIRKCRKEGFNTQQSAITIIERLNDFAQLPRPSIVVYFTDNLVPAQSLNASNYQDRELFMLLDTLMHSFARETKLNAHMSTHYAPSDAGFLRPEGLEKSEPLLEQESPLGFDKLPSLNVPTVTLGMLGGNLSHVTEYVEASMCQYLPQFVLHLVDTLASNPLSQSKAAQPHDDLQLHLEELGQRAEEIAAAALNEIRAVDQQSRQSTGFYSQVSQGTLPPETLSYKDFKRKQRQQQNKKHATLQSQDSKQPLDQEQNQQQIQAANAVANAVTNANDNAVSNVAANVVANTVTNANDNAANEASKTASQADTNLGKPLSVKLDTETQSDSKLSAQAETAFPPQADSKLASTQASNLKPADAPVSDYATTQDASGLDQASSTSMTPIASSSQEQEADMVGDADKTGHAASENIAHATDATTVNTAAVDTITSNTTSQADSAVGAAAQTTAQTHTAENKLDPVHAANAKIQHGLSGELLIQHEVHLDPDATSNLDQLLLQNSPEHVELHNIAPSLKQTQSALSTQPSSLTNAVQAAHAAQNTDQSTLSTTKEKNISPVTAENDKVAETAENHAAPETQEQDAVTDHAKVADTNVEVAGSRAEVADSQDENAKSVVPANYLESSLGAIPVDSLVLDNTAEPVAVLAVDNNIAVEQNSAQKVVLDTEADSPAAHALQSSKTMPDAEPNLNPNTASGEFQMQPEAIPELTKVDPLPQTATEHQIIDQAQQKLKSAIGSFKKLFSSNLMHKPNKNIEPQLKINEVAPKAKESEIDQALAAASAIALAVNGQDQNEQNNVAMGFTATDGEDLTATAANGKLVNVGKLVADTDVVDEQLAKSKQMAVSQPEDEHKTKHSASSILAAAAETQLVSKISAFGSFFGLGKDKHKHKDNTEKVTSDHTSAHNAALAQPQVSVQGKANAYDLTHNLANHANNSDLIASTEQLSAPKGSGLELTSGAQSIATALTQEQSDILVVPVSSEQVVTDSQTTNNLMAASSTTQSLISAGTTTDSHAATLEQASSQQMDEKQSVNNQQAINQQQVPKSAEDSSANATVNNATNAAVNNTANATVNNELSAEAATKSQQDKSTQDATSVTTNHSKSVQATSTPNKHTQAASDNSKSADVHISVANMANTTIVYTNETEQHQSAAIAHESFTHYDEEESANGNTRVMHNALAHMETPHAVMPAQDTIISGHEKPHEQIKLDQSNTVITHNRQAFVSTRTEALPPLKAEVKETPLSTLISKPMPTQLQGASSIYGHSSIQDQSFVQGQATVQNKQTQDNNVSVQNKSEPAHNAEQVKLESAATKNAQSIANQSTATQPTNVHSTTAHPSAVLPSAQETSLTVSAAVQEQKSAEQSTTHGTSDTTAVHSQQQTLESSQLSHSARSESASNAEQSLAPNDAQKDILHTAQVEPEDSAKSKATPHSSPSTAAIYTNENDSTAVNTSTPTATKEGANHKATSPTQARAATWRATAVKPNTAQQNATATPVEHSLAVNSHTEHSLAEGSSPENSLDANSPVANAENKLAANLPDLGTPQEAMLREAALLQIETTEDATKSLALNTIEHGFSSSYGNTTIEGLSLEKLDPAQAFAQLLGEIEEDDSAKNNFRTDAERRKPATARSKTLGQHTADQLQTGVSTQTTDQQPAVEHNQAAASQMQRVTQSQEAIASAKSNEELNGKLNPELALEQTLMSPGVKGAKPNAAIEGSVSMEQTAPAPESQQRAQVASPVKKTTRQANRSHTSKNTAEISVSLQSGTQMLAQSTMQDNASLQSGVDRPSEINMPSDTTMQVQGSMQSGASMSSIQSGASMDYVPQQSNYTAPASRKAYVPKDSNFYGDLEQPTTQHVTRSLAPNVTGGSATLRTLKSMPTAQVKPSPAKIRSSQLAAKRGGVAGVPGLAGAAGVLGTGDGRTTISDLNPEPLPTNTRPTRRTGQSIGGLNKGMSNNSYYGPMASAITSTLIESRPAGVSAAFNGVENAISTSLRSSGVQAKTSPAPVNTQSTKNTKGGLGPGVTPRRQVLKPDAGGNNRDYANLATAMSAARLRNTKIRTPLKLNEPTKNLSASQSLNERRAALHKAMYGGLDEEIAVVNPVLGQDSKLAGNGGIVSPTAKVNRMESAIATESEVKKPSAVKTVKAVDKSSARNKPKGSFIAFDKGDFLNYDPTALTASFEDSGEETEGAAKPKIRRVPKAKNKPE